MPPISKGIQSNLDEHTSDHPKNSPIVYGLGTMGITLTAQAFSGYYLFYYVDVLGLTVALAAIVNVIYAIWDAVNDPLVGYLSDNTRSRWGRRRPWVFLLYFFRERFSKAGSLLRSMAGNVYTVYIIHLTLLWGMNIVFLSVDIPTILKFFIVSLIAVPLSFLLSSLIRKLPYAKRVLG